MGDRDVPMRTVRNDRGGEGDARTRDRLLSLVAAFTQRTVLVVGDLIADEFIYGEVARVSR